MIVATLKIISMKMKDSKHELIKLLVVNERSGMKNTKSILKRYGWKGHSTRNQSYNQFSG